MVWTLQPIDRGPEPAQDALIEIANRDGYLKDRGLGLAGLIWRQQVKDRDRNAFVVPFVPDDKDYNRYRKSVAWQKIRARVLSTARGRCRCCGGKAHEVHHRDYRPRVLAGNDDAALVAICSDCHRKVHFTPEGKRRAFWEDSEQALATLIGQQMSRAALT
ncbi:MAG TPA: HNH endonuclease signature motif containing protein [Rhizomicrobium sp.]|jgi:5-methylcytosine-specific restriction endonuclease McrA|nr:HNH endonuclease signature motif containing protein [Rhizomicrobium sp.]